MNHSDELQHLADCPSCRQRFSENVLPFDAARRREGAREFAATAVRIESERKNASNVVHQIRQTAIEEWPGLAESPALRNNAALEQMSEEIRKCIERKPVEALAIANLAASIAESLPANAYPPAVMAQIRSTALRDRANALRYLGRLDEAYDSIETAEARLAGFPGAVHDRAIIWLVKAMIQGQMDLFDESAQTITAAGIVFADVNDSPRFLQAGLVHGNLLGRQERYEEAQRVFGGLLSVATASRDLEAQARLHNNLGYCATNLDDYAAANVHFSQSIAKFTDLGFAAEVARTERGAGLVLIGKGQLNLGTVRLREARRAFANLHMPEEAGLCAIRLIETMVERGDADEARALADSVVDEFTAAGLDPRAIEAVTRLRAELDADGATAEAVRTVHALVQSLASDQARAS